MSLLRDRNLEYFARVRWMPPHWLAGPSARAWEDWYVLFTKHAAHPLHWTTARWSLVWRLPMMAVLLMIVTLATSTLMDLAAFVLWLWWHTAGPIIWMMVVSWVHFAKAMGWELSEEELRTHPGGEGAI